MTRRIFLERIAALMGAGMVARSAMAAPRRHVELQRSRLAGFQYHHGEQVWPMLTLGAKLDLVREPANPHDKRAVRVDWQGWKLGYLPRVDNAAVSHLLDNDKPLSAEIVILQASANPWDRIELAVALLD